MTAAPARRRRSSRATLLSAALAEFTEKGYEASNVTAIAERAGVTTGAVYAHFRGKLDLLLQALGIAPANALFGELTAVAQESSWSEVTHVLSRRMAEVPDPSAVLLLDAVVAARRDPAVAEVLRGGMVAYEDVVARATAAGTTLGLLDPALRPEDLSRVLTLLGLGRLVSEAIGAPAPSDDAYERLAQLLLQASGGTDGDDGVAPAIAQVRSRASILERARRELAESVGAAVEEGHSLRQVGAAAGVSHERVRQMVREAGDRT